MAHPQITVLEEVGSTNDEVLAAALAGAPHGTAVAARKQTAGRGQRGHVWESPIGNLYLSVLLRPDVTPTRLPGLAAACGLGALDGLAGLGACDVRLKWPNDLLAHGRKLGGILVEARSGEKDAGPFAVCGIGVNLTAPPAQLEAACLAELGCETSFETLAEALRDGIVARVDAWAAAPGDRPLSGIREDYLGHLAWLGASVDAWAPDGSLLATGTLETVDAWGRAVVSGEPFSAEQASLRPAAR